MNASCKESGKIILMFWVKIIRSFAFLTYMYISSGIMINEQSSEG